MAEQGIARGEAMKNLPRADAAYERVVEAVAERFSKAMLDEVRGV